MGYTYCCNLLDIVTGASRDMAVLAYKYFTIIYCGFYTFNKLLNQKQNAKHTVICLASALLLTVIMLFVRLYLTPLSIPIMIVFSFLFLTLTAKIKPELTITTTILSFGISYALFNILALLFSITSKFLRVPYSPNTLGVISICVSTSQLLLARVPFQFKRLRNGMPFLRSKGSSQIGVFVSVLALCCAVIFSSQNNADWVYIFPVVLFFLSSMFILFWWRDRLTKTYVERLRADEIRALQEAIQSQREEIHNLRQHNEMLAKIIHKDNKLIPAMELAVRECLQSIERESPENQKKHRAGASGAAAKNDRRALRHHPRI